MLRHICNSKRSIVHRLVIWLARISSRVRTRSTMSTTPEAVRPIELSEIREASERIAGTIVRTPLIRLELGPDAPDTKAVIASIGGGGLITGVASAIKALKPEIKVLGVEPETAAPAALSFEKGSPQVFDNWKASFVDGAGGQSMFPRMWERMKPVVDGYIVVSLDETKKAMRLMAEKTRIISEGAGALPVAAALTGKAGKGPIVAIVSGGNIDLNKFCELIAS